MLYIFSAHDRPVVFEGIPKVPGFVTTVELDDRWWRKENET